LKETLHSLLGGNSDIGLATAKQFVNKGAYVFITGRRDPELALALKEIGRNVTTAIKTICLWNRQEDTATP